MARKRDKPLTIRGTEAELAEIKAKATAAKLTQREYILKACLGADVYPVQNLDDVVKQIRAIGVNVNQIAHRVNYERVADIRAIMAVEMELRKAWQLLRRLIVVPD